MRNKIILLSIILIFLIGSLILIELKDCKYRELRVSIFDETYPTNYRLYSIRDEEIEGEVIIEDFISVLLGSNPIDNIDLPTNNSKYIFRLESSRIGSIIYREVWIMENGDWITGIYNDEINQIEKSSLLSKEGTLHLQSILDSLILK